MSTRKPLAPRNPFVAVAQLKKAGPHGKTAKALRRTEKMQDQRESGRVDRGSWLLPRHRAVSNTPAPTSGPTQAVPTDRFCWSVPDNAPGVRPDC